MARFERDGAFVEIWLAPGDVWSVLMNREGSIGTEPPALRVPMPYELGPEQTYREQLVERFATGWQRVRDPAREPEVDGEPRDPGLDAALRADDAGAALVYADWLQHRGHPRGALISVQHALETRPDDPALLREQARLLDDESQALLGPLARYVRVPGDGKTDGGIQLTWSRGFLERARITGFLDRGESEQVLWELLRHPSARCLRELEIGCHQAGDQHNELMSALLVHAPAPPPLRKLVLADFDDSEIDNIDISRAPLGDLSGLSAKYPTLEDVFLKGRGDLTLATLGLPKARRFAFQTSTMTKQTLATILGAKWPKLEELELWFGDGQYGGDCTAADVAPLFKGKRFPKLRTLRLMNTALSDELCAMLAVSRLVTQLETIDFSLGALTDQGAQVLVDAFEQLANVQTIGVFHCALSPAGLAKLRAAGFQVHEQPLAKAQAWREPEQKTGRYVSVSE